MATVAEQSGVSSQLAASETLSDEQIEHLLQEAEARLRAKAGLAVQRTESDDIMQFEDAVTKQAKQIRFPKLDHQLAGSVYIRNENGIAKTSAQLTVPAEQSKMAEELRSLPTQNPAGKKVVRPSISLKSFSHEEIISQIFLEAHQHLILRMPCLP